MLAGKVYGTQVSSCVVFGVSHPYFAKTSLFSVNYHVYLQPGCLYQQVDFRGGYSWRNQTNAGERWKWWSLVTYWILSNGKRIDMYGKSQPAGEMYCWEFPQTASNKHLMCWWTSVETLHMNMLLRLFKPMCGQNHSPSKAELKSQLWMPVNFWGGERVKSTHAFHVYSHCLVF